MIVRLSLPNNPKNWEAGTILETYSNDATFNWGDKAKFLLIKIPNDAENITRLTKKIDLSFMSQQDLDDYTANQNLTEEQFNESGKQPDLETEIIPTVLDTDESQWPEETPIVIEPEE